MKHEKFVALICAKSLGLDLSRTFMAVALAVNVDPDTLPDDLDAASDRFIGLIARLQRVIPPRCFACPAFNLATLFSCPCCQSSTFNLSPLNPFNRSPTTDH